MQVAIGPALQPRCGSRPEAIKRKPGSLQKEMVRDGARRHSFSILEFLAVNIMIALDFIAYHLLGLRELCNKE